MTVPVNSGQPKDFRIASEKFASVAFGGCAIPRGPKD